LAEEEELEPHALGGAGEGKYLTLPWGPDAGASFLFCLMGF